MADPPADRPVVRIPLWLAVGWIPVSLAGTVLMILYLPLDGACLGGAGTRGGRFAELLVCSVVDPPWGWVLVAWIVAPVLAFGWHIRRQAARGRR